MDVVVTEVAARTRFEARVGDALAGHLEYARLGGKVLLTHTEVEAAFEGQGVGGELAKAALDFARADGLVVRPLCPFVAGWVRRHTDYVDLIDPVDRMRVMAAAKVD
ncbi:GNAT family N-acetyltransferase [Allokutzneria multivorans]|uniref:GNAT family N-acetyltransferase n=1 Tax=Allokutzneria multivorans TaxID=1142134 RepID=A0ABP7TKM3_9PSEU